MDIFQSPGFLVNQLAHMFSTLFDKKLKEHGVTTSQWAILAVLWQQEGMAQVDLQDRLHLEGATITGLLKRMTAQNLVYRKTDLHDKRVQRVFLTERGRTLEHVLIPEAIEINKMALSGFSNGEREIFLELIKRAIINF
jgi:MarR family transcriptional regulator, organic hydroperoxide resistance regulator